MADAEREVLIHFKTDAENAARDMGQLVQTTETLSETEKRYQSELQRSTEALRRRTQVAADMARRETQFRPAVLQLPQAGLAAQTRLPYLTPQPTRLPYLTPQPTPTPTRPHAAPAMLAGARPTQLTNPVGRTAQPTVLAQQNSGVAQARADTCCQKIAEGLDRITGRLERLIGLTERGQRVERLRFQQQPGQPGGGLPTTPFAGLGSGRTPRSGGGASGGGGALGFGGAMGIAAGIATAVANSLNPILSALNNPSVSAERAQRDAVASLPVLGPLNALRQNLVELINDAGPRRRELRLYQERYVAGQQVYGPGTREINAAQFRADEAAARAGILARQGILGFSVMGLPIQGGAGAVNQQPIARQVAAQFGGSAGFWRTTLEQQTRYGELQARQPALERLRVAELGRNAARGQYGILQRREQAALGMHNQQRERVGQLTATLEAHRERERRFRPGLAPDVATERAALELQRAQVELQRQQAQLVQITTERQQAGLQLAQQESALRRANVDLLRQDLAIMQQREQVATGNARRLGSMNRVERLQAEQAFRLYRQLGPENAPADLRALAGQFAPDERRNMEEQVGARYMLANRERLQRAAPGQFRDIDLGLIREQRNELQVRAQVEIRLDEARLAQELAQQLGANVAQIRARVEQQVRAAEVATQIAQTIRWAMGG